MTSGTIVSLHSEWLPTREAAAWFGIHRRTLIRRARAGQVETRTTASGAVEYHVAPRDLIDATPRHGLTPPPTATPRDGDSRATLRAELVAAERRAAVAEYQLKNVTAERDEAREQGQRLADAMRKRHGLIKRLTARLSAAS